MKKLVLALVLLFQYAVFAQDGSYDNSFSLGTGATNSSVRFVRQLASGKIIIAGDFWAYNGNNTNSIARLNEDGTFDDSFTAPESIYDIRDVVEQPDGKLVIACRSNGVKRLNTDGSLDDSFYNFPVSGNINNLTAQGDKYIATGQYTVSSGGFSYDSVLRLNNNGTIDTTFPAGVIHAAVSGSASTISLPDGKLLLYGWFNSYGGVSTANIVRITADGILDTTFNAGTGTNGGLYSAALLPDGKILISGGFTSINGSTRFYLARLNGNGSLDTTFNLPDNEIRANSMVVQPDGKVLIAGADSNTGLTNASNHIVRLNVDGSIDTTFNDGTAFNSHIFSLGLQADGKLLAGGLFTRFNGEIRNRLVRLNNDVLANDIHGSNRLLLYPNPVKDRLRIQADTSFGNNTQMRITDISGKTLYSKTGFQNEIDLVSYTSGVYLLTVIHNGTASVHKIIKK